ncbi:MAG: hypothetical protein A2096_05435 [Spirochaetes bacterium GWF1_41_5]|nr:MAG: hypothetical protein A2096_05435 [Spirochaetes bacterium GWF1_41_5]HBE04684.1 hypothetical protein [Spirochaetia bacterium]
MGMFDTLIFKSFFTCEECNSEIKSTQTKQFENLLSTYTEGDFIHGAKIITGVIKEKLLCNNCSHSQQDIFISIWHSLFIGAYNNYNEAEKRIGSIEKTDLLDYIFFQQKRYVEFIKEYNSFYSLVYRFSEYCEDKENYFKNMHFYFSRKELEEYVKNDNVNETLKNILNDFQGNQDRPDDKIF